MLLNVVLGIIRVETIATIGMENNPKYQHSYILLSNDTLCGLLLQLII